MHFWCPQLQAIATQRAVQHRQSRTQKEERNTRLCLFSRVENALAIADLLFAAGKTQPPAPMFYFPLGKNGPAQSHLSVAAGPAQHPAPPPNHACVLASGRGLRSTCSIVAMRLVRTATYKRQAPWLGGTDLCWVRAACLGAAPLSIGHHAGAASPVFLFCGEERSARGRCFFSAVKNAGPEADLCFSGLTRLECFFFCVLLCRCCIHSPVPCPQ